MKKPVEFVTDHRELCNRVLRAYCRDARYVLEIGTGTGTSAGVMEGVLSSNSGHIWTIDLSGGAGTHGHCTKIIGNDLEVEWNTLVDLLYIDGCHKPKHVKRDLEKFSKFVNPGGWILMDDIRNGKEPRLEQVVAEFTNKHGLNWFYAAPEPCGIAVIPVTKRLGVIPDVDFHSCTDCTFCE